MNPTSVSGGFFERSLKTRVTLFTLAFFLAGIWSLAWYVSRELHKDMERLLGEQQASTAAYAAASIDGALKLRFEALGKVATSLAPHLGNHAALQRELEKRVILTSLFNAGAFVTDADGTAIASVPSSLPRSGVNYLFRNYIAAALKEGKATISEAPRPDLILLDLNLPKKDGRAVLAEIKTDPNLKRIPVVVLTTSRSEEDVMKAYGLHANAYVTKPVDLEQFMKIVALIDEFWVNVVTLPRK